MFQRGLHQGRQLLAAGVPQCNRRMLSARQRGFWTRPAAAEQEPSCLYSGFSDYNRVVTVLEVPKDVVDPFKPFAGSRVLLLDHSGNLHSVWSRDKVLSGSYWDYLAVLPSLVPAGPIGLLGLGAATVPRIMAAHYPGVAVHGWELDPGVVMAGRMYLGMQELEASGALVTHVGDALSDSAAIPGGFSGIIVDLFANAQILPQLTKRSTWDAIRARLADVPGARVLANLGMAPPTVPGTRWQPDAYTTLQAYEAMEAAFDGDVSIIILDGTESNALALTGPLPAPSQWPHSLPAGLQHLGAAHAWRRGVYPLQTSALPADASV